MYIQGAGEVTTVILAHLCDDFEKICLLKVTFGISAAREAQNSPNILCFFTFLYPDLSVSRSLSSLANNWASEASPTLGCSIEISRDICRFILYFIFLQ